MEFNVFCQITLSLSLSLSLPFITFYKYIMLIMFIFSASQQVEDQEINYKTKDLIISVYGVAYTQFG